MTGFWMKVARHSLIAAIFCIMCLVTPVGSFSPALSQQRPFSSLSVANLRDADFVEMMMGGERYEMVPLPDSMVDTTLFVGNLNEFVKDGDLSLLFSSVSALQSVPACVARKANMNSLHYGFVAFPSVEEKERAILKFHGYEFFSQRLKVECIRDAPGCNRVRVPEKMVMYMCGAPKRTSNGKVNTLRRVSRAEVDRMSKKGGRKKESKAKTKTKSCTKSSKVPLRMSDKEEAEFGRAVRKGYVSLLSTAYRRGRKSSALANVHREWCDARGRPQIVLCKASGGRPLDNVVVDLSPLRIHGILDNPKAAEEFLVTYKTQILLTAEKAGMTLRDDYIEDNTLEEDEIDLTDFVITMDFKAWSTQPIWSLPVVSVGVFEGERSKAKAMAKELAELWEIPEQYVNEFDEGDTKKRRKGERRGGAAQTRQSEHRRRNRNPYNLP